jgi:hypothetical protein
MNKILLGLMFLLCALTVPVLAQEPAPAPEPQPAVDILPVTTTAVDITTIPGVKEGVLIDFQHQRGLNFVGLDILAYKNFFLTGGLVSDDGAGAAVTYNLEGLKSFGVAVPITDVLKYINVGYGVAVRHITFDDTIGDSDPSTDNDIVYGPVVFATLKF